MTGAGYEQSGAESNFFHFFKHKFSLFGNVVQQERPCYGGHGGGSDCIW